MAQIGEVYITTFFVLMTQNTQEYYNKVRWAIYLTSYILNL